MATTQSNQAAHGVDRSRPPKPGKPSKVTFPTFITRTLANGISLSIVENHTQPYVSLQLVFRSGARDDGDLSGLANFTSNLLLSGAGTMDAPELAEKIDFLGADLHAQAGRDSITVQLGVLTRFLPEALDIMAEIVQRPTFPEEEIDRERKQAIATLKQSKAEPGYLAGVQFRRELHARTPYGNPMDGTEETLKRITSAECKAFHATHFTPGNVFMVAAGDVHPDALTAMLNERFGDWHGAKPPVMDFTTAPGISAARVVIVDRPGSVQSAIRVGGGGIQHNHPDYIRLTTLNTIIGGYFNSRINHNLREVHGYTYGARSVIDAPMKPGSFYVSASVGTDVTEAAITEIFNELTKATAEPVTQEELDMVKSYIIGSQALQMETPGQIAGFVRTISLYGLPEDYYRTFPAIVKSINREELLGLAQRYMNPNQMLVVVAGSAKDITAPLAKFGPVTVVDTNGKPI